MKEKKKIYIIVGARPNFIKLSPLISNIEFMESFEISIIHTGQHYDEKMSSVFFDELNIPKPDFYLNVGSASHAKQTADIMIKFEELLIKKRPDLIIVVGDVNSTIACALVASKLEIKIAHIESGLRSFNRSMPEEINRIVTDHISDILFAPSASAVENLSNEGLGKLTYYTGDIMYDSVLRNIKFARKKSDILRQLNLIEKKYFLVTLHRPYNVDDKKQLSEIISAISNISDKIVFPVHPRTKNMLRKFDLKISDNIIISEPFGYLDFLMLQQKAKKIITDSGGIQKEAYFLKVPCITLRSETEWLETLGSGANVLITSRKKDKIVEEIKKERTIDFSKKIYGDGNSSEKMIKILKSKILN